MAQSAIQLPWNPTGTRCGRATVASGAAVMSAASRTTNDETPVAASCTYVMRYPSSSPAPSEAGGGVGVTVGELDADAVAVAVRVCVEVGVLVDVDDAVVVGVRVGVLV